MRKFTLSVISALTLCSSAAMAQNISMRQCLRDMATLCAQGKMPRTAKAAATGKLHKAAATTAWKAKHDDNYKYNSEKSWDFYSETDYDYDEKGRTAEMILTQGGIKESTAYTYDDKTNQLIRELTRVAEDGQNYKNYKLHTITYDETDPSILLQSQYAEWDDTEEDWKLTSSDTEKSVKYDLARDDSGRPTTMTEYTYDGTKYTKTARNFFEYKSDGTLSKFTEETYSDESGDMSITYTNMKWKDRDGNLPPSMDYWFTGANRLESADVVMAMVTSMGTVQFDGKVSVTYEGKANYKVDMTISLGFMSMSETMSYDLLDDYGSYSIRQSLTQEGETQYDVKQVTTYDSHGNEIAYEVYEDDLSAPFSENLQLTYGQKYVYTYDEEKDCAKEQLIYEYDKENNDDDYQLLYKIVTTDFAEVAAAIKSAKADESAEGTIYDIKGQKVGTDLNSLPAGLYIVKTAGNTVKVMKK